MDFILFQAIKHSCSRVDGAELQGGVSKYDTVTKSMSKFFVIHMSIS